MRFACRAPHRSSTVTCMRARRLSVAFALAGMGAGIGCGGSDEEGGNGEPIPPPAAACATAAGGGAQATAAPVMMTALKDGSAEGWLASPGVADLDRDGAQEILIAREGRLTAFRADCGVKWGASVTGRIWTSPVIGDFTGDANLEVVVAARDKITMFTAAGAVAPGFPVTWRNEVRSLAAGDVDADGKLEIVAVTNSPLDANERRDIIKVWRGDGSAQSGFPANTS